MPVRGEIGHRRFDVHLFLWGAVCGIISLQISGRDRPVIYSFYRQIFGSPMISMFSELKMAQGEPNQFWAMYFTTQQLNKFWQRAKTTMVKQEYHDVNIQTKCQV